ncbi:hypothetical protein [Fulvimonas yonginensis]|uniref:Uncharacterized protein n=1 Tax=Fulvimonas yonginensis TaxID=1495200 RepID=A0ABU8JFI1_9GAMM
MKSNVNKVPKMRNFAIFKVSIFLPCVMFCAPLLAQHLPAIPNFCAGHLCIEALPVVNGNGLEYPRFSFQRRSGGSTSYSFFYNGLGRVKMDLTVDETENCANTGRRKKTADGEHGYVNSICGILINGGHYKLEIYSYGSTSNAARNVCTQAVGSIWQFHPETTSPIGPKINLNSSCSLP